MVLTLWCQPVTDKHDYSGRKNCEAKANERINDSMAGLRELIRLCLTGYINKPAPQNKSDCHQACNTEQQVNDGKGNKDKAAIGTVAEQLKIDNLTGITIHL
jgi:hypothetical protein